MIKYVWYNKNSGTFSGSWDEGDFHNDKQMLIDDANNHKSEGHVLIKYECLTVEQLEFCDLMKLN